MLSFWVVAEQKGSKVGRLWHLNLAELNLHPRPCSQYSLFCWKGTWSSHPTNRLGTLGITILNIKNPPVYARKSGDVCKFNVNIAFELQ